MTEATAVTNQLEEVVDQPNDTANRLEAEVVQEPVARVRGRVLAVNVAKGFAVIAGDDGREYFFHCSQFTGEVHWRRALFPRRAVEFEPHDNSDGRTLNPRRRDVAKKLVVLS